MIKIRKYRIRYTLINGNDKLVHSVELKAYSNRETRIIFESKYGKIWRIVEILQK